MAKVVTLMLNPSVDVMLEFDEFLKTKTNRIKNRIELMGGKGLNVSCVLSTFGVSVCATGFIGSDRKNELANVLKTSGIENAFVEIDGTTRTNFKFMDKSEGTITEANDAGFSVNNGNILELESKLNCVLNDAEILVLTGSLPKGVEIDFYAKCIEKANEKGIKCILDTSGEALKLAISKKPYAIKPNFDELCELAGKEVCEIEEIKKLSSQILDSGVSLIAVSMGDKGAMFFNNEKIITAKTFEIEFKSAVGAGDSMVAAMCYSILTKKNLEETAKLSVAAGCITTSKSATNLCTAEEVILNMDRVVLEG